MVSEGDIKKKKKKKEKRKEEKKDPNTKLMFYF